MRLKFNLNGNLFHMFHFLLQKFNFNGNFQWKKNPLIQFIFAVENTEFRKKWDKPRVNQELYLVGEYIHFGDKN